MAELTGEIKWFSTDKGYGFITANDGSGDYFVHHSDICTSAEVLDEGEKVRFEPQESEKGKKAIKVHPLKEA